MAALQLSCSDYLSIVYPNGREDETGYIAPVYLYYVLNEARKAGLVTYIFLNGPIVPIYVSKNRVEDAFRVIREDEMDEFGNEFENVVIRTFYKKLVEVLVEKGLDEIGFAYHVRGDKHFMMLVVNGKVYTDGEVMEKDELISSDAVYYYVRDLSKIREWVEEILRREIGDIRLEMTG